MDVMCGRVCIHLFVYVYVLMYVNACERSITNRFEFFFFIFQVDYRLGKILLLSIPSIVKYKYIANTHERMDVYMYEYKNDYTSRNAGGDMSQSKNSSSKVIIACAESFSHAFNRHI